MRLTSLHIPSDHRWVWCQPCNRSVPKTQLEYRSLLYGIPIQKVLPATQNGNFPIVSGPVYMRKTCHKGLRNFGPPVGRQLANSGPSTGEFWAANWRVCRQLANPGRQLATLPPRFRVPPGLVAGCPPSPLRTARPGGGGRRAARVRVFCRSVGRPHIDIYIAEHVVQWAGGLHLHILRPSTGSPPHLPPSRRRPPAFVKGCPPPWKTAPGARLKGAPGHR